MKTEDKDIRYGRFVTTGVFEIRRSGVKKVKARRFLECLCDCGSIVFVDKSSLRNGSSKSCGCLNRELLSKRKCNLIGHTFNGCVVNHESENIVHGGVSKTAWNCTCHCGNTFVSTSEHIKEGTIKSCGCKRWLKGKDSPNWVEGLDASLRSRDNAEYTQWRLKVYEKDNYICQCCGESKVKLNAHHLKSFTRFPEVRYDINNGVTLCEKCHKEFHKIYGIRNFTSDDFYEFITEKEAANED